MKIKGMLFCSLLTLFAFAGESQAQYVSKTNKPAQEKSTIWDDDSEANPYFKTAKKKSAVQKKKKREVKRSTFKRRVYTGPSRSAIEKAAAEKAVANFKTFFTGDYDVSYANVSYNVEGDVLSVDDFKIVPKRTSKDGMVPYYASAQQMMFRGFNLGQIDNTEMNENGELRARKVEIPVWNEKGIKKGRIDISQLVLKGNVPQYVKAQGQGKLNSVEVGNLRSEAIINETILNNIVRSKIFEASSATFTDVNLQKGVVDSLKQQKLDGMTFASARINGTEIPSLTGAVAAMTSYSARVLDTDLVVGARMEGVKDKPDASMEQLKKNVAEHKAALAAVDAEMTLGE